MAVTKIELINTALTKLGARPIVSLDDNSENARIINRTYDYSLRSVLSECPWNFALKRRLLAQSADELEWYYSEESYVYQLPADTVRVFSVNDSKAVWRQEGEYIISDTADLGIKYVYFITDTSKYPPAFTEALVDRLCSDIAFAVLNSRSVGDDYLKRYHEISLTKAMAENAQTGLHQEITDDAWELSKYGNDTYA